MEDVPQPASEPLEPGDIVRIYVGEADADASFHNTNCRVVGRMEDDLGEETGRDLDRYLYRLEVLQSGETLDLDFRHTDLVPLQ